ncbi:MAG: Ig-like domain-containing protein, partial [bacterium]
MISIYRVKFFQNTFLCIFLLLILTCTKKNPIDPTDSGEENLYVLTNIASNVERIFEGDSVTVRVQLLDIDEEPIQNHIVNFSVTIGSVRPSQNTTNENGWVETQFYSENDLGKATIKATSDDAISSSIEIEVLSIAESSLLITTARKNILANGVDTTRVIIKVQGDSSYSGRIVSLQVDPGEINPSTVTLGQSGTAEAVLTSIGNPRDSVSIITAEIITQQETITAVPVQLDFKGINLSVDANPLVIMADGKSTSDISVIIKETSTNFAISGQQVEFAANHGLITRYATTDDKGLARVQLTSSGDSALSIVKAYY